MSRDFYVVSTDGTVIEASEVVLLHLTQEEVSYLLDELSDSERYDFVKQGKPSTVEELAFDTLT